MPRKAMKCIVEIDLHVITCPGTFLRDYEYVYLHMEMLGLEARTKSVPPTFPLFFHERLKFERTFYDCTDPALVAALLKGEDIVIELRQHTDYITDGKVIAHCSSNTHDFLYPAIPPYYGSGREILLYKTSKFKPIRVTGEPVKLEFSTKTMIKEVPDYDDQEHLDKGQRVANAYTLRQPSAGLSRPKSRQSLKASNSTPDLTEQKEEFVIRKTDETLIENRDFSTFICPKPRRSTSPTRSSMRRSKSPSRASKSLGNATVESIPARKYTVDFPHVRSSTPSRHVRSVTDPHYRSYLDTADSLRYALDDLSISRKRHNRYYLPHYSTHLSAAMDSSQRIQRRVNEVLRKRDYSLESDGESDYSLDLLRESLRDERNAINDAIKEADREAFYRSLKKSR